MLIAFKIRRAGMASRRQPAQRTRLHSPGWANRVWPAALHHRPKDLQEYFGDLRLVDGPGLAPASGLATRHRPRPIFGLGEPATLRRSCRVLRNFFAL